MNPEASDEPAPTEDREPLVTWWWAFGALVVVALVLRLVGLGDRPMHHDESLDAWFSWKVAHGQDYAYDPVYHGPLRFFLTAGLYQVFGETETVARLTAALAGAGLVALVGATRRWLGGAGSLAAMALMAISPTMLYFSRVGREDSLMALLEVALLVVTMLWLSEPKRWHPVAAGALLAAAFATKETAFIVSAVLGSYFALLFVLDVLDRRRGRDPDEGRPSLLRSITAPGWRWWLVGVAAFAFIFCVTFSVGFTDIGGIADGATKGIRYWLSQQPVNRGAMPWPYYLVLLGGYEWPIVLLALGGGAVVVARRDRVLGLLVWTAVANLAIYSWASERFPWLLIHPLAPIVLLAGVAVGRLADGRAPTTEAAGEPAAPPDRPERWPLVVGGALVALVLLGGSIRAVYREPNNPRQLLVAVQTTEDVVRLRDRLDVIYASAPKGAPPKVVVDSAQSATWPWAWYLRDRPVLYADLSKDPGAAAGADVVLAMAGDAPQVPAPEGGWVSLAYVHRTWWLPPWSSGGAGDWVRWLTTRRTFGPIGTLNAVYLQRPGLPGGFVAG